MNGEKEKRAYSFQHLEELLQQGYEYKRLKKIIYNGLKIFFNKVTR